MLDKRQLEKKREKARLKELERKFTRDVLMWGPALDRLLGDLMNTTSTIVDLPLENNDGTADR
jgi:hypothetical protein